MQKHFYVFRHGETNLNKEKRWQGSGIDYDLNETGVSQARISVDKLKDKNLEIIFSSPLKRAKHTADIVGEALGISVEVENDLRECCYGDAEGQLAADLLRDVPEIVKNWSHPDYWDIRFPNGESKREALDRVLAVLERLKDENYHSIGIAIHGGTICALLNYFGVSFDKVPNCGAFHLIYDDEKGWFVEGNVF